jgi:hypothetical protein
VEADARTETGTKKIVGETVLKDFRSSGELAFFTFWPGDYGDSGSLREIPVPGVPMTPNVGCILEDLRTNTDE